MGWFWSLNCLPIHGAVAQILNFGKGVEGLCTSHLVVLFSIVKEVHSMKLSQQYGLLRKDD
jgi:hypothetical protein